MSAKTGGTNAGLSRSCSGFEATHTPPKYPTKQCRSMPLYKPNLSLVQMIKYQLTKQKEKSYAKPAEEPGFDACKCLMRELAVCLDRVLQHKSRAVQHSIRQDSYSEKECQRFMLEWAPELRGLSHAHLQQGAGTEGSSGGALGKKSPEEEMEDRDSRTPTKEEKLKEAQSILCQWAQGLESKPKGSVCLGQDVCEVIEDLEKQWKRRKLSNTLPVMEFIMWAVAQEQPKGGSAPQRWLRTRQKLKTSANYIPALVWSWILEAKADITLDPKTANTDLKLNRNRNSVKMDTIIESKDKHRRIHRGPHEYNGWWCVLGTVGFTAGRYYWEVGVKGKREWRLGVVKESAPRKGFADLNTQSGYWTLRLQLGELMALTVPVTKLPEAVVPSKVGIYLDIEEGQLSFYDAERRSHIYTFNDTFTEKVYPVFGTAETDRALVIL